jgi:ribose/xylose/arabinose/galactoside ABC-type transport system permease subunit
MTTPPLDAPAASPPRFAPRPKLDPRWVKLLWPLLALLCLLAFDFLFIKDFFHIGVRDGHLFGSVIDVLERASPVMLLSIGMTLVIATGGVDLSVGSIIRALVIQTQTTTILNYGVAPQKTLVVRAAVVIVVCLLQSEGLREKVAYLRKARSA